MNRDEERRERWRFWREQRRCFKIGAHNKADASFAGGLAFVGTARSG